MKKILIIVGAVVLALVIAEAASPVVWHISATRRMQCGRIS